MATQEVKLRVTAKDEASGTLNKLRGTLDNMSQAVLGVKLGDLINPTTMLVGAVGALANVTKEAFAETLDYNKSVRELADNLNITTVETSQLIQTADDFTVSQNDLTTALEMALKNGFAPSIDTLAQMSDAYLAINDPTERAAKLTAVFGRNWAALTPMLKAGSQAIREAAATQDENLLVTEEQARATREYEIELDILTDKFDALKRKLGNELIPVANGFLEWLNQDESAMMQLSDAYKAGQITLTQYSNLMNDLGNQIITEQDAVTILTGYIQDYDEQLRSTDDIESIRLDRMKLTVIETDKLGVATLTASEMMQKYTSQLLFNLAAANLDADGAIQLASAMGLIDGNTVQAYDSVKNLTDAFDDNNDGVVSGKENVDAYVLALASLDRRIRDLPDGKTINIDINVTGDRLPQFTNNAGVTIEARANGGAMYQGQRYIVGEGGYPETVIQGANGGYVYPTAPTNNYNLTINSSARAENVAASFALMQAMAR